LKIETGGRSHRRLVGYKPGSRWKEGYKWDFCRNLGGGGSAQLSPDKKSGPPAIK